MCYDQLSSILKQHIHHLSSSPALVFFVVSRHFLHRQFLGKPTGRTRIRVDVWVHISFFPRLKGNLFQRVFGSPCPPGVSVWLWIQCAACKSNDWSIDWLKQLPYIWTWCANVIAPIASYYRRAYAQHCAEKSMAVSETVMHFDLKGHLKPCPLKRSPHVELAWLFHYHFNDQRYRMAA